MANSEVILSLYDRPMWDSIEHRHMALQQCVQCGAFRYPPGPVCAECHSLDFAWRAISGRAEILSWVIFRKQYFDDHPAPYNVIAVRLEEGPIVVSNLTGTEPDGSWIGTPVTLTYRRHQGRLQHAFALAGIAVGA